uniref:AMP-binding protein n=2 Tax=Phenylobacterium aquaticum TaxID=1763816 RepID=UPI0026EA87AD
KVTFSAAVPTVWQMLLNYLRENNLKPTTLKRVVIGGSAVPEAIVRRFRDDYGVDVTHAWGMTETSPLGTQGTPNAAIAAMDAEAQLKFKLKQGRPPLGIDLKLIDDGGKVLPHDGTTFGKLMVKGPFVVGEYFRGDGGEILDADGYFDTGDVATIDEHGVMQITDRSKDVIKSGGEWISSIEIENIAAGHPKAELAAVIGVAHPKWDERPLLLVKLKAGETATKEEFLHYLEGKIAKWWMPDDVVFVDDIPLGATGKIDKKLIRQRMVDYVLPTAVAAGAAVAATVALAAPPEPKIYAPEPEPHPEPEAHHAPEPVAHAPEPQAPEAHPPEAPAPEAPAPEVHAEAPPVVHHEPPPADHTAWSPQARPVQAERVRGLTVIEPTFTETKFPGAEASEAVAEAGFPAAPRLEVPADPLPAPEADVFGDTPLTLPFVPGQAKTLRKADRQADRKAKSGGFGNRYLDLALLGALAPAAMVGAAMLGTRFGLMDWKTGLGLITLEWAPKIALLSVATGLVGVIIALFAGFGRLGLKAFLVLGLSLATLGGYVWMRQAQITNPPVNDVATDWARPLTFSQRMMRERGVDAMPVEFDPIVPLGAEFYAGRRVADVNAETCAVARPLILAANTAAAYARAKSAMEQAGLALVTDDPRQGRLEATARSLLFGLRSDVVVRILPDPRGARIDVRAVDRAPTPDLGANCSRIGRLMGFMRS